MSYWVFDLSPAAMMSSTCDPQTYINTLISTVCLGSRTALNGGSSRGSSRLVEARSHDCRVVPIDYELTELWGSYVGAVRRQWWTELGCHFAMAIGIGL